MNPLVSIGMPVYNEEKHIEDAIDSILAQTHNNFELIISDNASTDKTARICQEYALRDKRIRYYRNDTNTGSANNFNFVFKHATGKYFMWVSGHDTREVGYLAECVSTLEKNPNAVLCYTDAFWIDTNGKILDKIQNNIDIYGQEKKNRFKKVLFGLNYNYPIYGLIRTDVLRSTHLFKQLIGVDVLLLCEISLYGEFIRIPKPLHFMRKLEDYGNWTDYLTKLYGHQLSKFTSLKDYLKLINAFFSIINRYFKSRTNRIALKMDVLYFFFIKQRTLFSLLFRR